MDTRIHDLSELRSAWERSREPSERKAIEQAAQKIRKESGAVRSMREALIKEHRKGNKGNIKDIHDIVEHNKKYRE